MPWSAFAHTTLFLQLQNLTHYNLKFTSITLSYCLQGFLGSMPWSAFAFTTLFLQLQGWSDFAASAAMAAFSAADALGALLGGAVGDWAAQRFPDHGRITACQFSVGIGVPMFALIFQGLPLGSGGWVVGCYVGLLAVTGVLISWAATACNNPIFAEIVPPHLRTLVYAFDRCLEVRQLAGTCPCRCMVDGCRAC